jgi:hypothetical protein
MAEKSGNKNLTVKDFFAKIKALEENQDVIFELRVISIAFKLNE